MGWVGGGGWGWVASPRGEKTAIRAQTVVLCSQQTTGMYTNHRIDRDGQWQQFGTQPILISAPQWASWSCNAPTGFYRVGKKPSVKADQAIHSQAVDVRGRCMSESLRLGHNLDFSSCDIMVGFYKSSHNYIFCLHYSCGHMHNILQRANLSYPGISSGPPFFIQMEEQQTFKKV